MARMFGNKQQCCKLNIIFFCPNDFDTQFIQSLMSEAFELDKERKIFIKLKKDISSEYIKLLLMLTKVTLNDMRIPVFDNPIIESIISIKNTKKYIASVFFPYLSEINKTITEEVIKVTNQLILNSIKYKLNPKKLELMFLEYHEKLILPWINKIPGGRSTIPVLQMCWEMDIPFKYHGHGIYQIGWGKNSVIVDRSSNDQDSAIGAKIVQRKDITKSVMQSVGIPIPEGITINPKEYDLKRITLIPRPWVVKPFDQDRGIGVTVNISNEMLLSKAIDKAGLLSSGVLVERHVKGVCYRILVAKNQIINVVKRNPRNIIGDGKSSIKELIEQQNQRIRRKIPIKRIPEIQLNDELIEHIHTQGYFVDDIPKLNQKIELFPRQSTEWGGDPEEVTARLHPDNATLAISAANLFRLSCAGIDFISTDISIPWHKNGAVINEVNYAPLMGRTHEYQRAGIRKYLSLICTNGGRIPIEFFVGNALQNFALESFKNFNSKGIKCFYCDDKNLLNENSQVVNLSNIKEVFGRIESLRVNRQVEAIVAHINTDNSIAICGSPIEYIDRLVVQSNGHLSNNQKEIVKILSNYLHSNQNIEYVNAQ